MLLGAPLNVLVLQALASGPRQRRQLLRETGSPAHSTLRLQLKRLTEMGAVEKRRRNCCPGVLEYELTGAGRDLHAVLDSLERWLGRAPEGPLALGSSEARASVKAMADGWSTAMLRALAGRPLSLTELDGLIVSLSYPTLERRLAAMRLAGQVAPEANNGRGTPYAATNWLREGVGPLVAAARWERRHRSPAAPPIGRLDIEATFLLAVPLLELPSEMSGSCRMAAEIPGGAVTRLAGVISEVSKGRIVGCVTPLRGNPDAWALGPPGAWLDALFAHDVDRLELGGDRRLARCLIDGLHRRLFGPSSEPALMSPI